MSKLNKAQRKKAYTHVRDLIIKGNNLDGSHWDGVFGVFGVCEMLGQWLEREDSSLWFDNDRKSIHHFPEFQEEEPVKKYNDGPFWWDHRDNQIRIDVLNRCINKLKPIKKAL
jgi:hypothetical protein